MAKAAPRTPITATGVELLSLIGAAMQSEPGYLMMTQAEAADAINSGHAVADVSIIDGETAAVRLTEAGQHALTSAQGGAPVAPVEGAAPFTPKPRQGAYEIDTDVAMPAPRGGRAGSVYPFDALEVGHSFHVPKTDEMPDPVATLASTVSGATARYAEETGESETVKRPVYQKDADGKRVKGADGKLIKTGEEEVTVAKKRNTRVFRVVAATDKDPKGPGARVFRTA